MADTAKRRVGDYELLDHIGDGAQGKVFKARCIADDNPHVPKGTEVALKIIRGFDKGEIDLSRFRREAESFVSLSHPNLIKYHEYFSSEPDWSEEVHCLVVEFLDGHDLKSELKKHRHGLPWEKVKDIFEQCLAGLIYAREQGIVHRDIKPANIFLLADGRVKIIDFGIARKEDATASTTSPGFKGTYDYMAPDFMALSDENFRGDELSDIFSLGVCLYQAMTGKLPYHSGRESGWVAYLNRWQDTDKGKDITFPTGPLRVLTDGAVGLVKKCMKTSREERFASFAEVLEALGAVERRRIEVDKEEYVFDRYLGKGGFGEVMRAQRTSDGKRFAVKHLFPSLDPARFRREARLLQKYPHPNIVAFEGILKLDRIGGADYYLVLEYLEGMPGWGLRERIRREGALDPQEVLAMFRAYLDALDFLHTVQRKPILHRDITPTNLYAPPYDPEEAGEHVPKIFDMGIARSEQTETGGRVPGNPEYMAPESILQPDFRGSPESDIYCLGICLYEALTGKPAYPRLPKQMAEMWTALRERAEGRMSVSFDYPVFRRFPALQKLVQTAIERKPARRFRSAKDMAAAVDALVSEQPLSAADVEPGDTDVTATIFIPRKEAKSIVSGEAIRRLIRKKKLLIGTAAAASILAAVAGITSIVRNRPPPVDALNAHVEAARNFRPAASYVSDLRGNLAMAEKVRARTPRNADVVRAADALKVMWSSMPIKFDSAFAEALEKADHAQAGEILEEWKLSAGSVPFSGLETADHALRGESMEQRLTWALARDKLTSRVPEPTADYVAELRGLLELVAKQQHANRLPQARPWWARERERLESSIRFLPAAFSKEVMAMVKRRDLAAAEKTVAAWSAIENDENLMALIPADVIKRFRSDLSTSLAAWLADNRQKAVAACRKGLLDEATAISVSLSATAEAAPTLMAAVHADVHATRDAIHKAQADHLRGLVGALPAGLQEKTFNATIAALHGVAAMLDECRATWTKADAAAVETYAREKCNGMAETYAESVAAFYAGGKFDEGDTAVPLLDRFARSVPANFRSDALGKHSARLAELKKTWQTRAAELETVKKEVVKLLVSFRSPDPDSWRKSLLSWDGLRISEQIKNATTRGKQWDTVRKTLENSVASYVTKTTRADGLKQVRALLVTGAAAGVLGADRIKRLTDAVTMREGLLSDRAALERIARSIEPGVPATWNAAIDELAKAQAMQSLSYDPAVLKLWKQAEALCFSGMTNHLAAAATPAEKTERLQQVNAALAAARKSNAFERAALDRVRRQAAAIDVRLDNAFREEAERKAEQAREAERERQRKARLADEERRRLQKARERESEPPVKPTPPGKTPVRVAAIADTGRTAPGDDLFAQFSAPLQKELKPVRDALAKGSVRDAVDIMTGTMMKRCRKLARKKGVVNWELLRSWVRLKRKQHPGLNVVGRNDLDLLEIDIDRELAESKR